MPTPECNRQLWEMLSGHAMHVIAGMFSSPSDKFALAAAGALATSPTWSDYIQSLNATAVALGPTLAVIFVVIKIVLGGSQILSEWFKIWRVWRRQDRPENERR